MEIATSQGCKEMTASTAEMNWSFLYFLNQITTSFYLALKLGNSKGFSVLCENDAALFLLQEIHKNMSVRKNRRHLQKLERSSFHETHKVAQTAEI